MFLYLEELIRSTPINTVFLKTFTSIFCDFFTSVMPPTKCFHDSSKLNFLNCVNIDEKIFTYTLLWEAVSPGTAMEHATRRQGSEVRRKVWMSLCFTKHFLPSVSLELSFFEQMYSKSSMAKFLSSICLLVYSVPKEFSLSENVFCVW